MHLGCGKKYWDGWLNIDSEAEQVDIVSDVKSLPFPNEQADRVCAIHLIEHFYQWEAADVLTEWKRVMKAGGKIALELPCMDKVYLYIASTIFEQKKLREDMTVLAFWGDPRKKEASYHHKWGYTVAEMMALLTKVGFKDVKYGNALYHQSLRDMRIEAVK